ncbi:MAG TPA: fructose 1,6-bisphosphatase [Actinomycetota bacterium]|nr:fructose 1,6-bisphosphatase [Actinomycetota bacterium]
MDRVLTMMKAPTGGYVGDGHVHPAVLDAARQELAEARTAGQVTDGYVVRCGDDIALVVLHAGDAAAVAALGSRTFSRCWTVARELGQHGCRNGGPVHETVSVTLDGEPETVLCFMADKAPAGAWNLFLYRVFADPFNTPSLLSDPRMIDGFGFAVRAPDGTEMAFGLPGDLHAFLGAASGSAIVRQVDSRFSSRTAAVASEGPDPMLVVRCHDGFPSVGETLEPFAFPYAVAGPAGPLVPVSTNEDATTRVFGRAIGLGFQVTDERLVGPRDLLGDRAFDGSRLRAVAAADDLRRHGPFSPAAATLRPFHSHV